MKTVRLIFFLTTLCIPAAAQDAPEFKRPPVPEKAEAPEGFVPAGWRLLGKAGGDLNGDGRADAVVVAAHDAEASEPSDAWEEPRLFVVALGEAAGGALRLSAVSDAVVLCRGCGGVFGDPFESVEVERGTVVVTHYSGSRDRWGFTDRFRLQDGRWTHIGATERYTDTLDPSYYEQRDANLSTGLVIESGEVGESGRKGHKSYRRTFYEIRASPAERAPVLDGAVTEDEWPGMSVRLAAKENVDAGAAAWGGPDDASARLGADWRGGELYLRAEVTDDSVTPGDSVRLVSKAGQVVKPVEMKTAPRAGGYMVEARYTLKSLGIDELEARIREMMGYGADVKTLPQERLLRVSVEVVDEDAAPQKVATVLSTSRGGRKYPARVRLVKHAGMPLLEHFDREASRDVLPLPGFGAARPE